HRDSIIMLADRILADRHMAEGFSGHSFGPLAAYLKLRVEDMGARAGLALLDSVGADERRPPRNLPELRLMFAIAKLGVDGGLSVTGDTPAASLAGHPFMVPRQVALADGGASFFRLLAAVRADPGLAEAFDKSYIQGQYVAALLLDQGDDFKLEFANHAEAAGELALAAFVLGSRSDLRAYHDLLDRHDDETLSKIAGPRQIDAYLMTQRHQTGPQPVAGETRDRRLERERSFDVLGASYRMGGMAWLSILMNMTGQTEPIAAAARDFRKALDAGRIDPARDLDEAWLYLQDLLADEMGADALPGWLAGFDLRKDLRNYGGRAGEVLDWMRAARALAPYVDGGAKPDRPPLLSAAFDWDGWVQVADLLRDPARGEPDSADQRQIAVELLYRLDRVGAAIDMAAGVMPNNARLWIYRDLMQRLDWRCDGFSLYPGGELVMGGQVVYRFD
ncbi:MAG: hypothetical protein LJE68_04290, partial [Rhodobacter sp.]|nr:hypothetical protein [Rhodobacter sp.]